MVAPVRGDRQGGGLQRRDGVEVLVQYGGRPGDGRLERAHDVVDITLGIRRRGAHRGSEAAVGELDVVGAGGHEGVGQHGNQSFSPPSVPSAGCDRSHR
jgi:hypothetical protein